MSDTTTTLCKLCNKNVGEYIIPYLLCRFCWADYVVNEMNVIPSLTQEERKAWIEKLVNQKKE